MAASTAATSSLWAPLKRWPPTHVHKRGKYLVLVLAALSEPKKASGAKAARGKMG